MDELIPTQLNLHPTHREEIITVARQLVPIEACGMIGGDAQTSRKVYPISNTLHSPYEFLMDPEEMLKAFMEIEDHKWEVLAFFHSHPASPPLPSPIDLARNYYPHTPHLIAGKIGDTWKLRAFILESHQSREIPIVTPTISL